MSVSAVKLILCFTQSVGRFFMLLSLARGGVGMLVHSYAAAHPYAVKIRIYILCMLLVFDISYGK